MYEDIKSKHKSYGQLQIARVSGGSRDLFASSIKHRDTVMLRIYNTELIRNLNSDWYHNSGGALIEIEMSQTQFAEAITSMNSGSGTPVTIRSIAGETIDDCPPNNKIQEFDDEFSKHLEGISDNLNKLVFNAEKILSQKKAPNKSEKETILKEINKLKQEWGSNIDFINKMFSEQMDRTVLESKGEVEGFILNKIQTLGIESLKDLNLKLSDTQDK